VISYLLFVFALIIFITTHKKQGGENKKAGLWSVMKVPNIFWEKESSQH
jgi:hypothetical protein